MKKIAVVFIVCIVISCLFVGCGKNSIQFKPESKFSEVMNSINTDKPKVQKSSGVVIYRDDSKQNTPSGTSRRLGPNDMKFDLNVKF